MANRCLERAPNEPEKINVVRDPRYKSSCDAVCSNGCAHLRRVVRTEVMAELSTFSGAASLT